MEKKQEFIFIMEDSKVIKMSNIDITILSEFLAKAKRSTFAEGDNQIESSRKGSIDFLFQEGDLTYRDSYFGGTYDIGQEIVWQNDKPIWGMNYMGGMKEGYQHLAKQTFKFLRRCLKLVDSSMPFRGPKNYQEGDFEYFNKIEGDITRFSGLEKISFKGEEIYRRIYHGGLIK